MTDTADPRQPNRRRRRAQTIAALSLVILASLGVVVSLVGLWVRSTLFDTESFMEIVEPTLASEEVVSVMGGALSEQVVTAVDIEGRLEARLAAVDAYLAESLVEALDLSTAAQALLARADLPHLADLASPLAAPLEGEISEAIESLVASDAFQVTLPEAVEFAHQGAVALIRDGTDDLENVSIVNGEVRWNVLPAVGTALGHVIDEGILNSVLEPLQLPGATYVGRQDDAVAKLGEALGTVLPDGFGELTIMSEDRLENWQTIARLLDRAALAAIILTVVLVITAVIVSSNRRRTLVQFTVGSVVALLVAAIVQRNVLAALDEAIPGGPEQAAADVLFDAVFANLRGISWLFIVAAVAVGLSAHIVGQPRWLRALRQGDESDRGLGGAVARLDDAIRDNSDAFVGAGIGVALLVWWWVGLSLVSLVVVGLVLGGYLWYVTRLVARDHLPEGAEV